MARTGIPSVPNSYRHSQPSTLILINLSVSGPRIKPSASFPSSKFLPGGWDRRPRNFRGKSARASLASWIKSLLSDNSQEPVNRPKKCFRSGRLVDGEIYLFDEENLVVVIPMLEHHIEGFRLDVLADKKKIGLLYGPGFAVVG